MRTVEEGARRYAEKSLMAFLEGGRYSRDRKPRTLNWVVGVIRSSGVRGQQLQSVFQRQQIYGDPVLWQQAYAECETQGWFKADR